MAQTFTALTLSAATSGRPIKIVATATPGTAIHTATDADRPDGCDEVWLWAGSTASVGVNGTIQIGASGDDSQSINFRVPPAYSGPIAILAGHRVLDGQVITATASVTERINIWGNVNRVSQQTSS